MPLDGSAMGAGKMALLMRFPVGVVAAITPFNAPFNLAAHKIAPAIAAGNSDGAEAAATGAARSSIAWPSWSSKPACRPACSTWSTAAPRSAQRWSPIRASDFITFTGSSRAGAAIKAASGLRPRRAGAGWQRRHHRAR